MLALGAWSYRTQRLALRTAQVMSIDATTVHVSPSFGPAVFGTRDPRVVVPRWMLDRSADEIRLVLQHEQAHIAARDPLLLLSGCLALALLPWNPFAWFMLSRLRLAIELDCDARVLAAGASTRRYGALLIDLSAASAPLPALTGAPAFSHRASHLERRIRTMTTRPGSFRTSRQLFAGVLATCTLLAACGAELPTSAELEGMDVAAAQRRLARLSATAAATEFVVDGKASTEIAAQSIAAERIASIDIRKKSREANVISITTRPSLGSVEKTKPIGTNGEGTISVRAKSGTFDGLILLDNVRITPAEMNKLSPNKVESVVIIKGGDVEALYGTKGSEGVIKITTKK
ncbi:MAG: M56 family metallopeptidase [Gemmatimonas sp.]